MGDGGGRSHAHNIVEIVDTPATEGSERKRCALGWMSQIVADPILSVRCSYLPSLIFHTGQGHVDHDNRSKGRAHHIKNWSSPCRRWDWRVKVGMAI